MTLDEELLLIYIAIILVFCVYVLAKNNSLKTALKEAKENSRAKSDFVASVSHEIRAPMNAVLGFTDLLSGTTLTQEQKSYLDHVSSSGQLLLSIVNDVLDFSKLELGRVQLETIDFNLEHLVYDIFKIAQVRFKEQHINAYVDWDENAPRWVKGDPTRLRQVLLNLLNNAAKFTHHGDIGLTVKLVNMSADQLAFIRFEVKDSGIGITLEQQKSLFCVYSQAEDSTTRKYGGTGLGLAICKRIVEAMKGTIGVHSKLGEGSVFYFTLPLQQGQSLVEQHIQPIAIKNLKFKKVVLIESHIPSRQILEKYCIDLGLKIMASVNSGPLALDAINRLYQIGDLPDLIISDVIVPGFDGYDFAKKIRLINSFKSLRLIAVTSDVRVGSAKLAQDKGFDGFLPKPASIEDFKNIIAVVLGDKRPPHSSIITRHVVKELSLKGRRILVIDDGAPNFTLLKKYLDLFGCVTDIVQNREEAIERVKQNSYDLCFIDVPQRVEEIKKTLSALTLSAEQEMPCIVLIQEPFMEEQKKEIVGNNVDFLIKPVHINALKVKINNLINKV